MDIVRFRFASLAVAFIAIPAPLLSSAVCLYPDRDLSGFKIPLAEEVRGAPTIVVGTVVKSRGINADHQDPEGIDYWVYSVRVSEVIKGQTPALIDLFTPNNSGGYRMNLGETDLLFLRKRGNFYEANNCGNSGVLGKFGASPEQVRAMLAGGRRGP